MARKEKPIDPTEKRIGHEIKPLLFNLPIKFLHGFSYFITNLDLHDHTLLVQIIRTFHWALGLIHFPLGQLGFLVDPFILFPTNAHIFQRFTQTIDVLIESVQVVIT